MIGKSILVDRNNSVGISESNLMGQGLTVPNVEVMFAKHISIFSQKGLIRVYKAVGNVGQVDLLDMRSVSQSGFSFLNRKHFMVISK